MMVEMCQMAVIWCMKVYDGLKSRTTVMKTCMLISIQNLDHIKAYSRRKIEIIYMACFITWSYRCRGSESSLSAVIYKKHL